MIALARFFIENYKFTIVLSVSVLIFGIMGMMDLNSETYPAVDFSVAKVVTRYEGASAKDIELKITKPIEDELRKVTGIKDTRSISQSGLSTITVRVDDETANLETVMGDLERAVDRVSDLPSDLRNPPVFTEIKSAELPVLELAVVGPNDNRKRDIITDYLKDDLEDLKNVLNIRLVGFHKRNFVAELDLKKLDYYHISIDEIIAKIKVRNVNIPGGKVKKPGAQKLIRIDGEIKDIADLNDLVLRANYNGKAIKISDIAKVQDTQDEVSTLAQYNGEAATILVATKKAGADTIELVSKIMEKVERFEKNYPEYKFIVYHNESIKVSDKLQVLSSNAVTGLILVIFFLLVFLPGRIGLVASLSLPLSIFFTIGFMPVFDINLNAVTILALVIALGMLVDNSVVISENFARLRSEGMLANDAILLSIQQLWIPISATVFTTIAAFLPMLVTKGIMGKFILYIPIIVSLALLISLFESFFLLPMRLLQIDKNKAVKLKEPESSWFDKYADMFERFVKVVVLHRYITSAIFTLLLIGSVVMMTMFNKVILFPAEQVEIYVARAEMPRDITQVESNKALQIVSKKIAEKESDSIVHMITRVGVSQIGPFDPKSQQSDNVGMINIYVNEETKNNVKEEEFLTRLRSIDFPEGIKVSFQSVANGPPVGEPINATLRSKSPKDLDAAVNEVMSGLNKVSGLIDVSVNDVIENREIAVEIDYKRAAMLGVNVQSIGYAIRTGISGKVVSSTNIEGKKVDVKIQLNDEQRKDDTNLSSISVLDKMGNLIPVSKVAKFVENAGSHQIRRYDYKRSKTITANIEKENITAIVANKKLQNIFEHVVESYPSISMVVGGEQESTNESMSSLMDALVLSLIGIFALLVLLFNSFFRPAIIMSTIPLGLVGFSVAFALHQKPISFLAMIGVIGLGGIIVNSGIILISFIDELRAENKDLSFEDVLAKASKLRLRAVLVSSLTTISGLMPTAYGIGGLDAMLMPMTLAMAWGLTSGTILTLIWVPAAYAVLEDFTTTGHKVFTKILFKK